MLLLLRHWRSHRVGKYKSFWSLEFILISPSILNCYVLVFSQAGVLLTSENFSHASAKENMLNPQKNTETQVSRYKGECLGDSCKTKLSTLILACFLSLILYGELFTYDKRREESWKPQRFGKITQGHNEDKIRTMNKNSTILS